MSDTVKRVVGRRLIDTGMTIDQLKEEFEQGVADAQLAAKVHEREGTPKQTGFDLVPRRVIEALADHYAKGAAKYGKHDWRKGRPYSDYINSLERHLKAWVAGETFDEEGHYNLVAVAWLAFALFTFEEEHPELDDRPPPEPREER